MKDYKDITLSARERAEALLKEMSLEEKMAQVNCLFPAGENREFPAEDIRYGIGEVSTLEVRQMKTLEEAARWQRGLQEQVMANSPHHIPAIFHMEGLCGAFLQGAESFPSGIARGASWDPGLEEKIGRTVSRQERSVGITHVLAPVLDISRDSRLGRQGETYGEDPTLAAALGTAYTRGVQSGETDGRKSESIAKHFLGFHNSQAGIHGAHSETGDRLLEEVYGKPFQAAISEAGLRGVMPCYCSINGEPVSSSRKILTDLLRKRMGFDGVAAADYGAVSNVHSAQGVGESFAQAGLYCMEAGMDIEMQNCISYNEELKGWFADGEADVRILDQAVQRVLEAKFRMGLFEHPFALEGEELKKSFFSEEDQEISLQSALESLVLLKNDGVLPLKKPIRKIAVVGCHAANVRSFFGGYTHLSMVEAIHAVANSIAGMKSGSVEGKTMKTVPGTQIQSDETEEFDQILRLQKPDCKNLVEMLREKLPDTEVVYAYGYPIAGNDLSHIGEALEAARDADVILMTLGGKHGSCSVASMGEGVDGTDIGLPLCQETFIRRAAELGKPMVGVHFNGRPISSDVADEYLDAILEAWNPSEMGAEAIAQALLGEYNPGGKMPVCTARNAGQIPVYYNHPNGSAWHQGASIGFADYVDLSHKPRYFFGQGLSYTTFDYRNLQLSQTELAPDGSLAVSLEVTNTGELAGDEVVQLYYKDIFASVTRPVKELAGFLRLHLEPGETRRVCFTMEASQTAFLDRNMDWKVEKGEFRVMVGSSSEDIRLEESFRITGDRILEGRNRAFYAKAEA